MRYINKYVQLDITFARYNLSGFADLTWNNFEILATRYVIRFQCALNALVMSEMICSS